MQTFYVSLIVVKGINNRLITYKNYHFNKFDNKYELQSRSIELPTSSQFPIKELVLEQLYLLTSTRVDGNWYFCTTINIINGITLTDTPLLQYIAKRISDVNK